MNFKKLSDSHMHSNRSFDAVDTVDAMCQRAIEKKMYSITITDHFESYLYFTNPDKFGDAKTLIPISIKEIREAQEKYKDKIQIFCGLEVGEPLQDVKATEHVTALTNYDFLLGSLHNITAVEDFYFLEYTLESAREIITAYFKEMLEMVKVADIDSLAHITYPFRYIVGRAKLDVKVSEYKEEIDKILKVLVERGIALEINTSGLRQNLGTCMPDIDVLQSYKDLGGMYVTVGSDAHNTGDLGKNIEDGYQMMLDCGFKSYTIFKQRKPILIDIE